MRYPANLISGMFIIVLFSLTSCAPKPMTDKAEHTASPSLEVTDTSKVTATTTITGIPASGKTPEIAPTAPNGQLYIWWDGFPAVYGELNLEDSSFKFMQPASSAVVNPADSVALAFSNHSNQIAYLTLGDDFDLHVADLELNDSVVNKVELPKWITAKIDMGEKIPMRWGPQDNTLLVINDEGGSDSIVYSIKENQMDYLADGCSTLVNIDSSLELWCELQNETDGYLVLRGDGQLRRNSILPIDNSMPVKNVSFNNKGDKALVETSSGETIVVMNTGDSVDIAIKPVDGSWSLPQSLYWFADDSLALVYGISDLCPPFFNDIKGQYSERPCWHVVNPKTGEIIWHPTEELASAIDSTWDRIDGTDYPAAISPDGKWLVLSLREGGLRYTLITSLKTSQTQVIGDFEPAAMIWVP